MVCWVTISVYKTKGIPIETLYIRYSIMNSIKTDGIKSEILNGYQYHLIQLYIIGYRTARTYTVL